MMARVRGSHHNVLDKSEDGLVCLSICPIDKANVRKAGFDGWSFVKLKVEHEEGHLHHGVHRRTHRVVNIKKDVVESNDVFLNGLGVVTFILDDEPDEAIYVFHCVTAEMFLHVGIYFQTVLGVETNLRQIMA